MKLSLAWIFDHINADWKSIDVAHLVNRFNQVVAEIEGYSKISVDLSRFTLGTVQKSSDESVTLYSDEWKNEVVVPARKGIKVGQQFLLIQKDSKFTWATLQDLGSEKEGLVPPVQVPADQVSGSWKKSFEVEDYCIELDNKSVTHRPDMWGHRGFAREVAALLNLPFKPLDTFLREKAVKQYDSIVQAQKSNPFTISIEAPQACKRFAGIYFENITWQPSELWMVHRLARIDARAVDAIVDITNYVMFDIGQPLHAFDAKQIAGNALKPRMAKLKESVTLLDGTTIELFPDDLVIADAQNPLSLAGVMGGKESSITSHTAAILLESASFDATTIRHAAVRHKKRSEASARFEKSLDPNQNIIALKRFLQLFHETFKDVYESPEIFSLGAAVPTTIITIPHDFIEKRLGTTISPEFVITTLQALEFEVAQEKGIYTITVPTFRGTKDIKIKEDIVEEVGRYLGYMNLPLALPCLQMKPSPLGWLEQQRKIKQFLTYGLGMQELYTYAFFDEEFLAQLKWPGLRSLGEVGPTLQTLQVQNPVSENWRRLVTTLVPNMLKAVVTHSATHDTLKFFELARIWHSVEQQQEKKSLAGIQYHKRETVDFYTAKADLEALFAMLKIAVTWERVSNPDYPWYASYQTAYIMHKGTRIGIAGKLHPTFLTSLCSGDAFIFELDADYLLQHGDKEKQFQPISKYPAMERDISILLPREISAEQIKTVIAGTNTAITHVDLIDFFEKDAWPDKRSLTFRFTLTSYTRTMTKEEADLAWDTIANTLKQLGATIR